ncbi:hypothetical protein ACFQY4_09790 [Catellatospora bangladeshensis]|uniref:Uncharacterized protein n=1 Tax=Catellatospora bangladeshensis TaxID=310355 RepID=A0A8J3NF74_9ACTN|nr:hypothetical protein [Catellatospora bangladeshensis]GIF79120.1 hypothetical protein Cba03nite_04690 [Catellatospora bangladeshensis]
MTLTPTFLTLYTGAVIAVSFAATLFLLRERLTMVEEAKLILDRVDGVTDGDGQWWAADDPDQAQAARRRAVVAFWRRALNRRRPGGSRWRSTGPAGDPVPTQAPAQGSAAVPALRRPEADPEVTAYLDAVPPYPAVDYRGRHTATGAYPQVPSSRQAYL